MDCIFCRIVLGDAPSFQVHEDELTTSFLDLFPVSRGHLLVVPKQHCENLYEVSAESLAAVAENSRRLARVIRRELEPDGLGVYQLNGAAAGQTVFHYHMHLIPRAEGSSLQVHARVRGDEEELRSVAGQLRRGLERAD